MTHTLSFGFLARRGGESFERFDMAWNPSPEVQVARDAAAKLAELSGVKVNRVVIVYTRDDRKMGYISFGATRELCAETKRLADTLWQSARRWFSGGF